MSVVESLVARRSRAAHSQVAAVLAFLGHRPSD